MNEEPLSGIEWREVRRYSIPPEWIAAMSCPEGWTMSAVDEPLPEHLQLMGGLSPEPAPDHVVEK